MQIINTLPKVKRHYNWNNTSKVFA